MRWWAALGVVVCGVIPVAALSGCGRVEPAPTVRHHPSPAVSVGAYPSSDAPEEPQPTDLPLPATLPGIPNLPPPTETAATPCAGGPTGSQVIAALGRKGNLLPSGPAPTVAAAPLCAGSWQYTVLAVAGLGQLDVVTKGRPSALTVVTAGTDVCTPDVTNAAPAGILSAAHCR